MFEQHASGRAEAFEWDDDAARPALAAVPELIPSRRRRNIVIAIALTALVALNAWFVHDLVATNTHARQLAVIDTRTQAQVAQARATSAELKTTINRALSELAKHTTARDALTRDATATRAAAARTSTELKSVLARIEQQHGEVGPLSTCVTRLQGALNALSGGDTAGATWSLALIDDACKGAGR